MTTFQVETWQAIAAELRILSVRHWEEIALHKDKIPLSLDEDKYAEMQTNGILHIVSARNEGELVGYFIAFLLPHPHYKTSGLFAFTDIYFLLPEYRKAGTGAKLLIFAEQSLKDRNVTKCYISHKVHQDHQTLFELLGWELSDKSYTKVFI